MAYLGEPQFRGEAFKASIFSELYRGGGGGGGVVGKKTRLVIRFSSLGKKDIPFLRNFTLKVCWEKRKFDLSLFCNGKKWGILVVGCVWALGVLPVWCLLFIGYFLV